MATSRPSSKTRKTKPKSSIKKTVKKSGAKKAKVSPVASRARKLGLESMGYGRWGKMGRITHRTVGGKLEAVKDSKLNRVKTREGKAKATSILSKMATDHTQKLVKIRMALKKAEGRGDDEKAKQLKSLLDRSQKEMQKAKDRLIALNARKKKAA
jgi:hypothetical protein